MTDDNPLAHPRCTYRPWGLVRCLLDSGHDEPHKYPELNESREDGKEERAQVGDRVGGHR